MSEASMTADEEKKPERQWPYTLTLKMPVDVGSERITSLVFRRGKLGDLKGMRVDDVPPADQLMLLASRMCGQPLPVIEKLEAEDAAEVIEIALGFFGKCLAGTGTR